MRVSILALCASVAVSAGAVGHGFDSFQSSRDDAPAAPLRLDSPRTDRTSRLATAGQTLVAQANPPPAVSPAPLQLPADTRAPPAVNATPVNATPGTTAPAVAVDESALRYFAQRGDTARLQAEIARLRALYPNWQPPANPLAGPQNSDPQLESFWQLYAQGKFPELRKAIADRQVKEPNWQTPADLVDRLKLAEARAQLIADSDSKHHEAVIKIAADNPSLLTCAEVDVLWRVAEALASFDKAGRARDAYLYVLNNCSNTDERVATVQKASALLPAAMIEDLLGREKTGPDGKPEFDRIRDDIARRLIGEGDGDAKLVVPAAYLARLENLASSNNSASDALLLGWYYYRRANMPLSEQWFRRAWTREDDASASQGLALVLIDRKASAEAEAVIFRWRDASDDAKGVYLAAAANLLATDPPVEIDATVMQRMAPFVVANRDAAAAQQFGWYARAFAQPQTAAEWFKLALTWKSDNEPAAYGLALSRYDLQDKQGLAELKRVWGGDSERIQTVGDAGSSPATRRLRPTRTEAVDRATPAPVAARPPVADRQPRAVQPRPATQRPLPDAPVALVRARTATSAGSAPGNGRCSATQNPEALAPADALNRGWCLMNINRPVEAAMSFEIALRSPNAKIREDAAYGQSLAYLRYGLTDKAAVASSKAPQSRARSVELQKSILADRAVGAFKLGRYRETLMALDQRSQIAPEQYDLMGLRGYSYMSMKRYADARQIFEALAQAGDKTGLRGMADLDDVLNPGN